MHRLEGGGRGDCNNYSIVQFIWAAYDKLGRTNCNYCPPPPPDCVGSQAALCCSYDRGLVVKGGGGTVSFILCLWMRNSQVRNEILLIVWMRGRPVSLSDSLEPVVI
jgi:hypothetical protein